MPLAEIDDTRCLLSQEQKIATLLAQAGNRRDARTGAISVPIYQTASFGHPALGASTGFDYSRTGFGGMIAFEVDDAARVPAILAGVQVFLFAESLGGVESLITYPAVQTHADIDPATRARLGIDDRLLRLSVGIEDAEDLINDLQRVL
jgi:cystathionine beta-lyase/cystathionine gamma-synthase